MTKLLTMDLGNFNIKTSENIIFQNRMIQDNERDIFGQETVKYNGNVYFVGVGSFDKTIAKVKKENYLISVLFAVAKSGVNGTINTILNLPASQIVMKQELIDMLEGKQFDFEYNGAKQKIKFNKVGVLKEGFSSFYSLPQRNKGLIAIFDIGGRSTDVFLFENGLNAGEKSVNIGTMDLFDSIAERLNGEGQNRTIEDIQKLLDNDLIDIKNYQDLIDKYAKNIVNALKVELPNLNDYQIYVSGGGMNLFYESLKQYYSKVGQMQSPILANVKGSYNIGVAKGLDK